MTNCRDDNNAYTTFTSLVRVVIHFLQTATIEANSSVAQAIPRSLVTWWRIRASFPVGGRVGDDKQVAEALVVEEERTGTDEPAEDDPADDGLGHGRRRLRYDEHDEYTDSPPAIVLVIWWRNGSIPPPREER